MTLHEFKHRAHEIIGEPFYYACVTIHDNDRVEWAAWWAGMQVVKSGTPEQVLAALDVIFSGDKPDQSESVEVGNV